MLGSDDLMRIFYIVIHLSIWCFYCASFQISCKLGLIGIIVFVDSFAC